MVETEIEYTKTGISIDNVGKYYFMKEAVTAKIIPFMESFNNIKYLQSVETETGQRTRYAFEIDGFNSIYLFIDIYNYTYMRVGACKNSELEGTSALFIANTINNAFSQSSSNIDGAYVYTGVFNLQAKTISFNNVLKMLYLNTLSSNAGKVCISTTGGKSYITSINASTALSVYDDDDTTYSAKNILSADATYNVEGYVLVRQAIVTSSNNISGIMRDVVLICNSSFSGGYFQKIDVDGMKYRQLFYMYFMQEGDEA